MEIDAENKSIDYEVLLDIIYENPKKVTYLAIGCANIRYPNQSPPHSDRQQYPLFLENIIQTGITCRVILIDPNLESPPSIFKLFEKVYTDSHFENVFHCQPNNVEVIAYRKPINNNYMNLNSDELHFFDLLNQHIMDIKGILLAQDFTGMNIGTLQNYYYSCIDKEQNKQYMKSILYDFTYGQDKGCIFDLTDPINLPIIKIKSKTEIEIFNYLSKEFDNTQKLLDQKFLTPDEMNIIIRRKIQHFKYHTYALYRRLKNLLIRTREGKIVTNSEYKIEKLLFINAGLDCYNEYINMVNSLSAHTCDCLSDKLDNQLIGIYEQLISIFTSTENEELIKSLGLQIYKLDIRSIYTWVDQFEKLVEGLMRSGYSMINIP